MKTYKNCVPEKLLALLAASPEPMTSKQIAAGLNIVPQRAIDVLNRLHKDGKVTRTGTRRGFDYAITKTGETEHGLESVAGNVAVVANEAEPEFESVSPVRSEE